MIVHQIAHAERIINRFNFSQMSVDMVLKKFESSNIIIATDTSIETAAAMRTKRRRIIYYNPHLTKVKKLLVLCHEWAHHFFGHVKLDQQQNPALFADIGKPNINIDETIAWAFACLAFIPTPALILLQCETSAVSPTLCTDSLETYFFWDIVSSGMTLDECRIIAVHRLRMHRKYQVYLKNRDDNSMQKIM